MSANAEIIAELRRVLNERDEAREQLDLTKRELGRWVDRETKAVRERDSYQRQLDAIGDAIVTSITKRIEPRISRHPVTVVMAAGSLIAKIGEAIGCEFEDGDDLLEAVKELVRECDEARAACPDCAMWAERSARWHDDMQRAERERDEARAEVERLRSVTIPLAAQILANHEWVTDRRECLSFCLHCGREYNSGHAYDCEVFGQNGFLIPEARHV